MSKNSLGFIIGYTVALLHPGSLGFSDLHRQVSYIRPKPLNAKPMATLARHSAIPTISGRNILYGILFLAVVVALFFIPELLNINLAGAKKVASKPAPIAFEKRDLSPTDEVLYLINSGYYSGAQVRNRKGIGQNGDTFQGQPISWDVLKSDKGEQALSRAQSTAKTLLTKIDKNSEAVGSRTSPYVRAALINFIAGVELVKGEGNKVMSAREAAQSLENLDLGVARALSSSAKYRDDYIKWMEVSLAPALGTQRSQELKEQALTPFDPAPLITNLNITKSDRSLEGGKFPKTTMKVQGVVFGSDVKRIALFKDGEFKSTVSLASENATGERNFSFSQPIAYGRWTLKIYDKKDNVYEKTYQFFPFIEAYPRKGSRFELPKTEDGIDPGLDRLFTYQIRRGAGGGYAGTYQYF